MDNSWNMNKRQKTSYKGYSEKVRLETRGYQRVSSGSMALSDTKTKSLLNTERLLEKIVDKRNLYEAYKRVVKNKGKHGIDGMEVGELLPFLKAHVSELIESLLNETYRPQPVRRVEIPKPNGGVRLLGIPTVVDRMLQQAIANELNKIYEPTFSNHSHGFRVGRSCHTALEQAKDYINEGFKVVVDIDLEKFFDNVNHDILMAKLAKRIQDKRVLRLIRRYLNSGIMLNGVVTKSEEGTPQGGPLSPLLSNILLDELDKELVERGHRFVRYADDCNIYVKSERAGTRVLKGVTQFLNRKLKLRVNENKSAVGSPTKRKFLGYSFYYRRGIANFKVHEDGIRKFKSKIKEITNRNISMNFEYRMKKLNEITRGWINYYKLADMKKKLSRLDSWICRRLRACIWKTWKRVRTRYKNLMKLGIDRYEAWKFANTRKGYWRTANSPILGLSITNERLSRRGFKSLSSQYAKVRLS